MLTNWIIVVSGDGLRCIVGRTVRRGGSDLLSIGNLIQRNLNQNKNISSKNAFENVVYKLAAILLKSSCTKSLGSKFE